MQTAAAATPLPGPTRLQGASRRGLEVSPEAVQERFPALAIAEAEAVQRVLQATVPATLGAREAMEWGTAPQKRYGELVDQALQLGQHPQRVTAQQHMRRLHDLLQEVADAIEEQLHPGLLTRWRAGPWALLARHRAEIDQLRQALAGAGEELARQLETLEAWRRELAGLSSELQAYALAATWLVDAGPALTDPRAAQALLRRATELSATHAHIAGADALREQADMDLRSLCAAMQQSVLLLLPAWLEKAMHAGRGGATATAALELQRELHGVLGRLPGRSP